MDLTPRTIRLSVRRKEFEILLLPIFLQVFSKGVEIRNLRYISVLYKTLTAFVPGSGRLLKPYCFYSDQEIDNSGGNNTVTTNGTQEEVTSYVGFTSYDVTFLRPTQKTEV